MKQTHTLGQEVSNKNKAKSKELNNSKTKPISVMDNQMDNKEGVVIQGKTKGHEVMWLENVKKKARKRTKTPYYGHLKIACWNISGINLPLRQHGVKSLTEEKKIDVMDILKTKLMKEKLEIMIWNKFVDSTSTVMSIFLWVKEFYSFRIQRQQ